MTTFLEDMKSHVLKGAGVLETAMFARLDMFDQPRNVETYNHGQYHGANINGTFKSKDVNKELTKTPLTEEHDNLVMDDFHSPLRPSEFFELRLKPQLNFYRARLPEYTSRAFWAEVVLAVGAAGGTILAMINLANWSTIIVALTAMLTGWAEFSNWKVSDEGVPAV